MDCYSNDALIDVITSLFVTEIEGYKIYFKMSINGIQHDCIYYIDKRKILATNGDKKVVLSGLNEAIIVILSEGNEDFDLKYDHFNVAKLRF